MPRRTPSCTSVPRWPGRSRACWSMHSTTSCTCPTAVARFMQLRDGVPTHNLLDNVHPDLRLDLRTALFRARPAGDDQEQPAIEVDSRHRRRTRAPHGAAGARCAGRARAAARGLRGTGTAADGPPEAAAQRRVGAGAAQAGDGEPPPATAPAGGDRTLRGLDRGADGLERGVAGAERGAALGHRGTGDQPRGAAVHQRGADHRQQPARADGRRNQPRQRRPAELDRLQRHRHGLRRPEHAHQTLHAARHRVVQPDPVRHRPAIAGHHPQARLCNVGGRCAQRL